MGISSVSVGFGLVCVGIGIAVMGYYIGKGLQRIHEPNMEIDFYAFLDEKDLGIFLNLNQEEIQALINHSDIPKIQLNGTVYYPKKQLIEWMTTTAFTTNDSTATKQS